MGQLTPKKSHRSNFSWTWKAHLGFEELLPDDGVDAGLEPGGDGGPGHDEDDAGHAGVLVVAAEVDHHQGDELHAPGDQVEGPVVGGRTHPVDEGEAEEPGHADVADHQVEVLLGEVLLDVEPGPRHQVDGQAVSQAHPGEEGLLEPSLEEVGQDHDGHQEADTDAGGVVEESVPAQFGCHEEDDQPGSCEAQHPVVDVFPLQTQSVAVLGLHTDTGVLEWTDLTKQ